MSLQPNLALANQLIAALPPAVRSALLAQAELVELPLQALLHRASDPLTHAWFVVDGVVLVQLSTPGAAPLPLALVGSEGVLDVPLLLAPAQRTDTAQWRVLAGGRAFRLAVAELPDLQAQHPALRDALQAYAAARHTQLAQQALCLSQHAVLQRLARALLAAHDRLHSPELFLTHGVLAQMVGTRRESVTQAAQTLQQRGLISYSRGYVMLLSVDGLYRLTCPCYDADVKAALRGSDPARPGAGAGTPFVWVRP